MMRKPTRASTQNADNVVHKDITVGAQPTISGSAMDADDYCEPATKIVDNTTQAPVQYTSYSVHNGTTAGAHFTQRGSPMEVELYCEPSTAMVNESAQAPIGVLVDDSDYLVPASAEKLGKSQSCNQQTSNGVTANTTNEDEYERASIISDKCWTERDVNHADIVSQSVATEEAIYAVCDADTDLNAPETTSREQNVCKSSNVVLLVLCINRICLYRCLLLH